MSRYFLQRVAQALITIWIVSVVIFVLARLSGDPITLLADWLKKNRLAESKTLDAIDSEVSAEIQKAVNFALEAPYPPVDEVGQHVYA